MSKIITTHLTVSAPVEDLWHTLTDLTGYRGWNPFITHRGRHHQRRGAPGPDAPAARWSRHGAQALGESETLTGVLVPFTGPLLTRTPSRIRRHERGIRPAGLPGHSRGQSQGDGDLAADLPGRKSAHGLGNLVERVGPADARGDLAGVDECAEPVQVAGSFLVDEVHEPLAEEG